MKFNQSQSMFFYTACIICCYGIYFVIGKKLAFWEVFQHEMTHLIFALITFNKIEEFQINKNYGGRVSVRGESNTLYGVAPYFFPLYSFIPFCLSIFISSDYQNLVQKSVFVLWVFYTIQLSRDFSFKQPDIANSIKFYSIPLIVCGNIFFFFLVMHFSTGNFEYFLNTLFNNKYVFFDYIKIIINSF